MVTDFSLSTIIEWCNSNQGFVSGILSLLTLFVSIIAICISLYAAHIPYRTKVRIKTGVYFYDRSYQPCVIVSNYGNTQLLISYALVDTDVGKAIDKFVPGSLISIESGDKYVGLTSVPISHFKDKPDLKNKVLYGYVQLANGKTYKKKLDTIDNVLKTINELEAKEKDE